MTNKSKKILTEISAGELLDKISILEIKLEKIEDKESLMEVTKEYESLKRTKKSNIKETKNLQNLVDQTVTKSVGNAVSAPRWLVQHLPHTFCATYSSC